MNEYPIKTPEQLGAVLQGYRREKKLTQQQVGAIVGITQQTVSGIELAPAGTSLNLIFRLLAALNLELVIRSRKTAKHQAEW